MGKTCLVYSKNFEEKLKDLISYNPETGHLFRLKTGRGVKKPLSQPTGTVGKQGYIQITVARRQLKAHRVAWFLYYGAWPKGQIDHINKNKGDNRITNLREGDSVNQHNREIRPGRSGVIGAHKSNKRFAPYVSSIKIEGVKVYLGYFQTAEAASAAYKRYKDKILASK